MPLAVVAVPEIGRVRVPVVAGRGQWGQRGVAKICPSRVEDPVLLLQVLLLLKVVLKDDRVIGVGELLGFHLESIR